MFIVLTRPRVFLGSLSIAVIAIAGLAAWRARPYFLLWSAASELNQIYGSYRPFAYRWAGAQYGAVQSSLSPEQAASLESTLSEIRLKVDRAEKLLGRTARSLQLSARVDLLSRAPDGAEAAVSKYKLALLLDQQNPDLQLELGVAYALRAKTEGRPLDYEPALENMLRAGRQIQGPEVSFNTALLFEEIPLPYQTEDRWRQAIQAEKVFLWQDEETRRFDEFERTLQERQRYERELTSSPESYVSMSQAGKAAGGDEFTLDYATREWLPQKYSPNGSFLAALNSLAAILRDKHDDHWLNDMLRTQKSSLEEIEVLALQNLSQSISANLKGEHLRADVLAKSAETLFHKSRNPAGILRSRLEHVYSLDRRSLPEQCLTDVKPLMVEAGRRNYVWIESQARLEEITCLTRTRSVDVIQSRNQVYESISSTGYEGLTLRALGFLTEGYVSGDSRLTTWKRGYDGLHRFWSRPLPVMRGYAFYFSLAHSASEAGNYEAAVVLVTEGTLLLKELGHSQLRALLLSNLGAWELATGREQLAATTFAEMSSEFNDLDHKETHDFRLEAEIVQAKALINAAHPGEALAHLQQVAYGLNWPYPELSANIRRSFLPAMGDAYLKLGDPKLAASYYVQAVSENREKLRSLHDRAQRDNAEREVGSAWHGLTEVDLRALQAPAALATWEAFRSGRLESRAPEKIQPPAGTCFVVYAFLPGGLSAWLVNAGGVKQRWLDEPQIRSKAVRFSELVANPDSPLAAVSGLAQELYELLLEPFAGELPSQGTLIVDADGILAGIPWAALEDHKGHALIERFALSQAVGWEEVAPHLSDGRVKLEGALIFGPPLVEKELLFRFPTLPDAVGEAQRLHRWLPDSLLLEKQAVTEEAFVRQTPQATLLHFASHGISNGGFGALLLASAQGDQSPGRFLTADEIAGLDLHRLQLAVLAACSSGAGEESGVINLDGLTRAFLEAGAARVIAARWDVSSAETTDLMLDFYDGLRRGKPAAEALRQAELNVRQTNPHPYFWAGFQVFGAP